jgi:hypothetical protein
MRPQQRQRDLAQDRRRGCAIELRRLDQARGNRAQPGRDRDRGERRVMQRKDEHDPETAKQRVGRAWRGRERKCIQQRRCRPCQGLVGKRRDLRRDQERHHIEQREKAFPADVGRGEDDRKAHA